MSRLPPFVETTIEIALFQAAWWIAVVAAAARRPWIGIAAIGVFLALRLVRTPVERRGRLLAAVLAFAAVGFAIDSLHAASGLLSFAASEGRMAPLWIVALWAQLAGAAPALAQLAGRPLPAAALGAAGGPLAYLAGERVGAVELGSHAMVPMASLVLVWTLFLPVAARLCRWALAPRPRPLSVPEPAP